MKITAIAASCMLVLASACSSQDAQEQSRMQCLTGQPVFKGNSPFPQLHLRTATGLYVLAFQASSATDFQTKLAARQNTNTEICGRIQPNSPPLPDTLMVLQIKTPPTQ